MPASLMDLLTIVTITLAGPSSAPTPERIATDEPSITGSLGAARARPVDETALRYYAAMKQTARVEAETRRLQRLDPVWKPPGDLWQTRLGSGDESALWDLFAADKIDELRVAIKARQDKDPAWVLSSELDDKIRRKELRRAIMTGVQSKRWGDVAAIAGNWRLEVDARDTEILWMLAASFAQARRGADCRKVLESILATSADPRERIATIHKALALLPMRDAEDLIRMGKVDASGVSEFDPIAIDITRARISAVLHDTPGNEPSQAELKTFQDYASADPDPDQIALLAWLALKQNNLSEALDHFKSSIAKSGDATVAHGLAHTLKRANRLRDAEEVAYAWREPSSANNILFIDILADQLTQATQGTTSIEPERIARYAEVTLQTASGEGAQALAWYAYNSCQLDAAAEWFRRAIAWYPKQTTVYGYALVLRRLKRTQEFLDIVNRYDGLFAMPVSLLFADESHAPDPCDRSAATINQPKPVPAVARPSAALYQQMSVVPLPGMLRANRAIEDKRPKPNEFPIAVNLENPYRAPSSLRGQAPMMQSGVWRAATVPTMVIDARRVPGVAAMPYEKFGVPLLPGWNGGSQAAVSDDLRLRSARGTPWADQTAIDAVQTPSAASSPSAIMPLREATAAMRFHP